MLPRPPSRTNEIRKERLDNTAAEGICRRDATVTRRQPIPKFVTKERTCEATALPAGVKPTTLAQRLRVPVWLGCCLVACRVVWGSAGQGPRPEPGIPLRTLGAGGGNIVVQRS